MELLIHLRGIAERLKIERKDEDAGKEDEENERGGNDVEGLLLWLVGLLVVFRQRLNTVHKLLRLWLLLLLAVRVVVLAKAAICVATILRG